MSHLNCLPQTDMDCFVNSQWKEQNKHPEKTITNFSWMQEQIDTEMISYIKTTTDSSMVQLRESYEKRNKYLDFFKPFIDKIIRIQNISMLAEVVREFNQMEIYTIFSLCIKPNFKEPDVYVISLSEVDLTLEDTQSYYSSEVNRDSMISLLTNFVKDLSKFIVKTYGSNIINSEIFMRDVIVFETLCSNYILTLEQKFKPDVINNLMLAREFYHKYDTRESFFRTVLQTICKDDDHIIVPNMSYFKFLSRLLDTSHMDSSILPMLKNYLIYQLFRTYVWYLPVVDSYSKLYVTGQLNPDKLYVSIFYKTFGPHLERFYAAKNLNKKKTLDINEMFKQMIHTGVELVEQTPILSVQTKSNAIAKLKHMDIVVGVGDSMFDLSQFPKLSDCFYTNLTLIAQFYQLQAFRLVNVPVNKRCMTFNNNQYAFAVNAYYDQNMNIIYVPISIIGGTLYDSSSAPISNYSGIGFTIGHEIMHALDNHGADYDYLGHYHNWWTPEDRENYDKEVKKVIRHYSAYKINDIPINGEATITENIADIVGIKLSLYTYLRVDSHREKSMKKYLDKAHAYNLKYFFYRWAEIFRSTETVDLISNIIKIDEHSPNVIRINAALSHLDEYYEAFGVKSTDNTYLGETESFRFI